MTDGIRTTVLGVDGVSEVEVQDDGFTGEPIPLWALVPYGGAATTGASEREQAIRLAREALDQARRLCWEREIALLELTGESPEYADLLRTYLGNDRESEHRARVAYFAALVVAGRSGIEIPEWMRSEVAERVAALRIEDEKPCCRLPASQGGCR